MIRRKNELIFDVDSHRQVTLTGYDWRNAVINWRLLSHKNRIYYVCLELFRFKLEYQYFNEPF